MAAGQCVVVRGGGYEGKQGGRFAAGVSTQSAGSRQLCLHRLRFPPGTRGHPHVHAGHESAIYMAAGVVEVWHGDGLSQRDALGEGDYIYIPPDTPHLPVNAGTTDAIAIVARTDPDEQEGVRLIELPPWLDEEIGAIPVAGGG